LRRPDTESREAIASDAKFLASAKVRYDLRTVDDVFAWQARDVRARSADVFALDDCDPLSFPSKRPRSDCGSCAATEHHQIKLFQLRLLKELGRRSVLRALHADSPCRGIGSLLAWLISRGPAADAHSSDSPWRTRELKPLGCAIIDGFIYDSVLNPPLSIL